MWETESGYPRYYIPLKSLHEDIKRAMVNVTSAGKKRASFDGPSISITEVETVEGKETVAKAVVERLTIGPRSMTWVRFLEGPLKGFIRFDRSQIGFSPAKSSNDCVLTV